MTQSPQPSGTQERRVEEFVRPSGRSAREVQKVIVGHDDVVNQVLIGLFAGGHVLLEGRARAWARRCLVRTLAESLDLTFSRIQFTPDLMPADIIGTNIIVGGRRRAEALRVPARADLRPHPPRRRDQPRHAEDAVGPARGDAGGNRSPCRARPHPLPTPFFVLATQNPIEMEGTYPLPEAQLDRFLFKLRVRYPALEELTEIIDRTTRPREVDVQRVMTGPEVMALPRARARGAAWPPTCATSPRRSCWPATRQWERAPEVGPAVRPLRREPARRPGPRPRRQGARAVRGPLQRERARISAPWPLPALRHRIILNFEGEAEGIDAERLIEQLVEAAEDAQHHR